jgi:hypothetical protein
MLFELPLVYKVTGQKRGNRRTTSYSVVEMIEVDIRVVDPADAPVAVEWDGSLPEAIRTNTTDDAIAAAFSPAPRDGRMYTRLIGDAHYGQVIHATLGGWIGPRVDADLLHETRGVGMWLDVFGCNNLPDGPFKGVDNLGRHGMTVAADGVDEVFERVQRTTRGEALAKLNRAAKTCAFVGGVLYRECEEPKIIYAKTSAIGANGRRCMGHVPFVTCDVDHARSVILADNRCIIDPVNPISRWRNLVSSANKVNKLHGSFETLRPTYAGRDPVVKDVASSAEYRFVAEVKLQMKEFMSRSGARRLAEMSTPVIIAYCAVVDAHAALGSPNGMDELDRAVSRFIEIAGAGNGHEYTLAQYALPLSEMMAERPVELAGIVPSPRS